MDNYFAIDSITCIDKCITCMIYNPPETNRHMIRYYENMKNVNLFYAIDNNIKINIIEIKPRCLKYSAVMYSIKGSIPLPCLLVSILWIKVSSSWEKSGKMATTSAKIVSSYICTVLFLLSDLLYGTKEIRGFPIIFISFVIAVIFLIIIEIMKRRVRFYSYDKKNN